VGIVFFLGGATYWFVSGRLQSPTDVRIDHVSQYFVASNAMQTITMLNIVLAVAGGLGMVAFGVGLQGEKRNSGTGAMVTSGVLCVVALGSIVGYIALGPSFFGAVVVLHYAIACGVLFLLAGHSASLLKSYPPPADQNVVDDAWLEDYERDRRSRRGF
jgi:Trk-type K+ transport system membrane component